MTVVYLRFLVYVSQLRGLHAVWGADYDAVIECMPPIISIFLGISMYLNGIFNRNKMRDVLSCIERDSNYYINRPEERILRHYEFQGRMITICYATYVYVTLLVYLLLPNVPLLLDLVIPSNRSHEEKHFLYELDYGVDSQRYFYCLTVHSYLGTVVVANLIASCDTTYMLYAQHAYALLAMVSYQLRTVQISEPGGLINAKDYRSAEKYADVKLLAGEEEKVCQKMFLCIKEHQNAIRYANLLEATFAKSILAQLFFNVLCLSVTGVETVMKLGNMGDMMRFGTFTIAQAVHIFFLCLPGQRLLDHSEQVYAAACDVTWYTLPRKCHNLYKFLLARSLVTSKITAFKIAPMTMETFLAITHTAMSYFTVLLSAM